MTVVRIIKNWFKPDLMKQTPGNNGIWRDIYYTEYHCERYDYVIVLNHPMQDLLINCSPQQVWAIMQEPPNEYYGLIHRGDPNYYRIYTSNELLIGERYIYSQPALPWHIQRDYDFLTNCRIPEKSSLISWITSNISIFKGHKDRLRFLKSIKNKFDFDLFGRGFNYLHDKWDGLAPYKYSFAIENFMNRYYWSEKIADCFLSWTMPVYYGCTDITKFFPEEAIINIDINDPNVLEKLKDEIMHNKWKKHIDAIEYSRNLILNHYQFFPFVTGEIEKYQENHSVEKKDTQMILLHKNLRMKLSLTERIYYLLQRYIIIKSKRTLAKITQIN